MADQRRTQLNPVITPAGTDILACRQSGDTRDKRLTVDQVLSLEVNDLTAAVVWANIPQANVPDPMLLGDGTAAAPSYSFSATGQQDVGFYRSETDGVSLALGGVAQAHWTFNLAAISGVGSDRPAMRSVSASATVPSLTPRNDDSNTGIGRADPDQLSLIAGGVEGLRVTEAAAVITIQTLGQIQAISGTLAAPGISFAGDSGSGLQLSGDKWDLVSTGTLIARVDGNRESFMVTSGSVLEPGLAFITDANTGIDSSGTDELSLIAGGIAGLILKELNSGVIQAPVADVAITAFATGGQGSAVALKQSYNVISVCASAGDSVKLPATFNVDSQVYIKNDGAESADVFPAPGDDLGAGADTAVAVAAGESVTFIATVANATWTQLIKPPAATLSFPILADDGTAGAPSYSFTGAPTSGLFRPSADQIEMSIAGSSRFAWFSNFFMGKAANAPLIINQSSSATVPNINPSSSDLNTGLGRAGTDQLSLIAGGVEIAQAKEVVGANQFIIAPGVIQNAAATPSLAFGDGNTGFYESADNTLSVSVAGNPQFKFTGAFFAGDNVNAGAMKNAAASGTVPTFMPSGSDTPTGIGHNATDQLSIIARSFEMLRATGHVTATSRQVIIGPGATLIGSAAIPSLAFGDGDSGFFESADDVLVASIAGVARFEFNGDVFQSQVSTGPAIRNIAINAILPQFCPNQGDLNTGLGSPGQDEISMIAGGVEGVRYVEGSGVRILASYQLDDTLTAFAGGGQGSATLLGSSYNEFTVVATAGDSAKLMVGHPKGTKVLVKNNGANSMDIFPAVGDQIDTLGLNNAVSLSAGKAILFMTTTANDTWAVMDFTTIPSPLLGADGSAAAPEYSYASDGGIGWFVPGANQIAVSTEGVQRFAINDVSLVGFVTSAGALLNETASDVNPTCIPSKGDFDTGLGWPGTNEMSLVAGALDCIRVKNISAARALGFYVTAPIVLQTGVAVTEAGIHAALVNLGLITA